MVPESIHPPHHVFYELSIAFCAKSAMRSIDLVASTLEKLSSEDGFGQVSREQSTALLDEIQNVVLQAAAVSRYFWSVRKGHEARAEALKSRYQVLDTSALRMSKDLRDAIEHFDERLDKYLAAWPVGHFFPEYFGPEGRRSGVRVHFFRAFFVDSGTFEMLGNRYEVQPIVDELVRVHKLLQR